MSRIYCQLSKKTSPLLTSLILNIGLIITTSITLLTVYFALMKLVTIFVIICRLIHLNNSNYLPLLITIYFYFASTLIDAIILFNHFGLFVLYNILLKTLRNIKVSSAAFIKKPVSNCKLMGI